MMKNFLLALFLVGMSYAASAQTVVDGKVTDRQGVPIPGARVEARNGGETTLTEFDGSFHLESQQSIRRIAVDYVGVQSKTVKKTQSPMTIVMAKTNIWNRKPLKPTWLLSLQAGFPESKSMQPSVGLMFGRFKKIGWYVKGLYGPSRKKADLTADEYGFRWHDDDQVLNPIDEEYWWTTGKCKKSYSSVTAGMIVDVWQALHVYAGAGYGWRDVSYEIIGGKYVKSNYSYSGAVADIGVLVRLGKLSLNGGIQMTFVDDICCIGNVGVGISF